MKTFNNITDKIKELNDYNNNIFYDKILKYNIVHISDTQSILQRIIFDKITKEEEICETIELTNWIIENYDINSLDFYLNKMVEP